MNKEIKNRKGVIRLTDHLIETMPPQALSVFFGSFFPVDIERSFMGFDPNVTYRGYSLHFDEVLEGEKIPEYLATVKELGVGYTISYTKLT